MVISSIYQLLLQQTIQSHELAILALLILYQLAFVVVGLANFIIAFGGGRAVDRVHKLGPVQP